MTKPFLSQQSYKNEIIMEQYWDTKELFIMTKSDNKWNLYNYTQNKKIGSSKDREVIHDKMYGLGESNTNQKGGQRVFHIAYCENEECPKKLECLRYMCTDEDRASKIEFKYICGEWNEYTGLYNIGSNKIREAVEKLKEGKVDV